MVNVKNSLDNKKYQERLNL